MMRGANLGVVGMADTVKRRPKYLNLIEIKLPLPGFVSILHRISGAGLFLCLPLLIYLLQLSLASPESFDSLKVLVGHPLVKLILLGLIWAYLHHFCMGIRVLLLDVHVGIEKPQARASAMAVLAVSLALTGIAGVMLW
jgi:succinate dehydrogenase / fumarate reductase cytochrome b subunit